MELYLVRHGRAFDPDPSRWDDDDLRPLSPEGEDEFRRAAVGIGRLAPAVPSVLSSPLMRARQTAEILEEQAGWERAATFPPLAPGTDPEEILHSVAASISNDEASALALIGHEPQLSELVSLLLTGDTETAAIRMGTGSVAQLSTEWPPAPGSAKLVRLLQSPELTSC